MDIEKCKTFKAVVDTGSFSAAAIKLNKVQSAVSYDIRSLERDFGTPLFDRSHYRPRLSEVGAAFYHRCIQFLNEFQNLEQFRASVHNKQETVFSFSITALYPFPMIVIPIQNVQENFSNTALHLFIDMLNGDEKVLNSKADIAITETQLYPQEIHYEKLECIEMPLVCRARHPRLTEDNILLETELWQFPQIVVKSSGDQTVTDKGIFKNASQWVVNDFVTKKQLILTGLGWGRMPKHLVDQDLKLQQLTCIQVANESMDSVQLYKAKRKDKALGPIGQFFWDAL